ncbi:MAG: hypothetical protein KGZ43_02090 [Sulfuritalea sp.]|nr:hypothetical protein [Sulfuritalea sp.]
MTPFLPFLAGLAAGAAVVAALRNERARTALDSAGGHARKAAGEAESAVRAAARSGLSLLRGTPPEPPSAADPAAQPPPAEKPARPTRSRKAQAAPAPDAPKPRARRMKKAGAES